MHAAWDQLIGAIKVSSPLSLPDLSFVWQVDRDAARFQHTHMHVHRQLTDLYLLGLAVKNDGRLASFDQRIPMNAVLGARPEHRVTLWRPACGSDILSP